MKSIYDDFINFLDKEDKEGAVQLVLSKLDNKQIDIINLYKEILAPSLSTKYCMDGDIFCIWKEHIRSSIVRTILECCYPYILKERIKKGISKKDKKAIVLCPSQELHEIGARMVVDFFIMLGFDAIFIGANTPREEIINAISSIKPDYVAISVTNYYNLVELEKVINLIIKKIHLDVKIILGGNAIYTNPEVSKKLGVDYVLKDFEDIKKLVEGK